MVFRFGEYEVDIARQELRRAGVVIHIEPQVFDVLAYLVRNRDRIVGRKELIDTVWQGRVVSEAALSSRISAARHAIGDTGNDQALIRTLHKRGFRFVGEVDGSPAAGGEESSSQAPEGRQCIGAAACARSGQRRMRFPTGHRSRCCPFQNMSGDPEQEYFADGLTEDIITGLSRQNWLFVIARNSSFAFKGQSIDVRDVAAQLGVRYILEGSVRRAASRVRVTGQLIDAALGTHLWAERYDRELADIFDLQDDITNSVTGSVAPQIIVAEAARVAPESPAEHRRLGSGAAGAAAHVAHEHRRAAARAGVSATGVWRSIRTTPTRTDCWAGPM